MGGLTSAASGNLAVLGRSVEKTRGLPLGLWKFLDWISADLSREVVQNPSTSITGHGGADRGTLGAFKSGAKVKYDLTSRRLLSDLLAMVGFTSATDLTGAQLIKIRPDPDASFRSVSTYFYEGGTYTPKMDYGRSCKEVSLTDAENKRVVTDVTYTEPTGDTISGAPIDKAGNTQNAVFVASRGRRPYDGNFTAEKSVYLKIISSTPGGAVVKAKIDVPSGGTDGTGFGAAAYGVTTFAVSVPNDENDGWSKVIDGDTGLPMVLGTESEEPYEITLGDLDLTSYAAGDEFEIPVAMEKLTKSTVAENRLSSYHLLRLLGEKDVRIDAGTVKIDWPFKEYYANGKRYPYTIDSSDTSKKPGLTASFDKRLFDRRFRIQNEADARFTLNDSYKILAPIPTTSIQENVQIFAPQCRVSTLTSGAVAGFGPLKEKITIDAEQPDDTADHKLTTAGIVVPDGFDDTTKYFWQINLTLPLADVADY